MKNSKNLFFIIFMYVSMYVCVSGHHMYVDNSQRPEKGFRSLAAGITGGWEPPDIGSGN